MKNTPIVELSTILQRAFRAPFTLLVFMAATLVACGQTGPLLLQVNDELVQDCLLYTSDAADDITC